MQAILEKHGIDTSEKISLGRGGAAAASWVSLEIQRFAGNNPKVSKVIGLGLNSDHALTCKTTSLPFEASLSGGGNGQRSFDLEPNALYIATDVLGTSSRRSTEYIATTDDDISHIDLANFMAVAAEAFPADAAAAAAEQGIHKMLIERARAIIVTAAEECAATFPETIDGITATPEFLPMPAAAQIAQYIKTETTLSDDEIAVRLSMPTHYIVAAPVFAKAETAELAIEQAKTIIDKRATELAAAQTAAAESGLPSLTGTPKQIAWATKIRADFAAKNPGDPALKRGKTAKYWIEKK